MMIWKPSISIEIIKRKAMILSNIRLFFSERNILEVDTPILSSAAPSALYLNSFQTYFIPFNSLKKCIFYLQTSPEFAMKRLLAAGSGSIYQIAKVFRNGEEGRVHSPEFTMLEWYRPQCNFEQIIGEVDALLQFIIKAKPAIRVNYRHIFQQYLNIDVFNVSNEKLKLLADFHIGGVYDNWHMEKNDWLEFLMNHVIQPKLSKLDRPIIIDDFPVLQSQLAKIMRDMDGNNVAKRFELYIGGIELANGYDEILNYDELRQRFKIDNWRRRLQNKTKMPIDENLLAAMRSGLPQCTGVALGLDRLMMLAFNQKDINAVKTFKFEES